MIFELENCLYVSSIPKPQFHEKNLLIFSRWRIFSNSLLFSAKTAFLQISADFVTGFKKFFFHLKALQTRMQVDVNDFFQLKWFRRYIYAKNPSFKNSQMCFFVTYCIREKHNLQKQLMCFFVTHFMLLKVFLLKFWTINIMRRDKLWPIQTIKALFRWARPFKMHFHALHLICDDTESRQFASK